MELKISHCLIAVHDPDVLEPPEGGRNGSSEQVYRAGAGVLQGQKR